MLRKVEHNKQTNSSTFANSAARLRAHIVCANSRIFWCCVTYAPPIGHQCSFFPLRSPLSLHTPTPPTLAHHTNCWKDCRPTLNLSKDERTVSRVGDRNRFRFTFRYLDTYQRQYMRKHRVYCALCDIHVSVMRNDRHDTYLWPRLKNCVNVKATPATTQRVSMHQLVAMKSGS
jgi:hypothetical protein